MWSILAPEWRRTDSGTNSSNDTPWPRALNAFIVAVVILIGAALVVAERRLSWPWTPFNGYRGRARRCSRSRADVSSINVPGRPATVSVSEVFVFTSILLFGPAAPTLTVAVDGLWISLTQTHRRSIARCSTSRNRQFRPGPPRQVFFAIAHRAPDPPCRWPVSRRSWSGDDRDGGRVLRLNSGLSADCGGARKRRLGLRVLARSRAYLAVNYYAAASLATLAVSSGSSYQLYCRRSRGSAAHPVVRRVSGSVESRRRAHQHVARSSTCTSASTEMLAIAVDAKDQVTHGHIRRVQRHTLAVARRWASTDTKELKAIEAGALAARHRQARRPRLRSQQTERALTTRGVRDDQEARAAWAPAFSRPSISRIQSCRSSATITSSGTAAAIPTVSSAPKFRSAPEFLPLSTASMR